jgi:hypothetical protein
MDVILLVWVPYRAGIFQGRSYEGHVRFFFDRFVGDVYVPLTVRLFADDTIAYVTISSDADAANLQQDLDKLAEWKSKWLMKFHLCPCSV